MRKLQFTNEKGETTIVPESETIDIIRRIATTHMVLDGLIAGIPVVGPDGGRYELLGADEYFAA